jgi:hypothetical protein
MKTNEKTIPGLNALIFAGTLLFAILYVAFTLCYATVSLFNYLLTGK